MKRALSLLALLAAACSSAPPVAHKQAPGEPQAKGGGYYKDDGPGSAPPPNLGQIPDAEPKAEPPHRYANRPYKVFGTEYVPLADARGFKQRGVASWYGRRFHGQKTASGELYDMYAMTAAHPTLPIPSYVRVTNLANGRSVVVRVNDRGPFHSSRVIDLSYAAAYRLGYIQAGSTQVELESVQPAVAQAGSVQPAVEQAGGVYVQVGAFTSRENAESLQARVARELGWLQESAQVLLSANLWRLQVGPYRSREDARSVADRIAGELDLKTLVVVR
ncbi:MAG TPA: septal ring lytic transglycosylase RlpA family protein [Burkholderiales bacterium]|jgi:rare lipoprotein A|nr:septal ring lytic transglycosylase RlpA family protein [Burkholderiales bacterium]